MMPISPKKGQRVSLYVLFMSTLYIECGHSAAIDNYEGIFYYPMPKIVNGARSYHGGDRGHPYLVTLQALVRGDESIRECHYKHICGGVIYDNQTILTAGHCFSNKSRLGCCMENPENCYRVIAGKHNISYDVPEKEQVFQVPEDAVKIHEAYHELDNDIALIHLKNHLKFNNYIQPIPLLDLTKTYGSTATIVGWGVNESVPSEANVKIYTKERCINKWGHYYNGDTMLCASGSNEMSANNGLVADACKGDSGGPLIVSDKENPFKKYLIGLISGGWDDCGDADYPGLYTKIEAYLDWIKEEQINLQNNVQNHKGFLTKHLQFYYNNHNHPHRKL